jgi:hypothetical protein
LLQPQSGWIRAGKFAGEAMAARMKGGSASSACALLIGPARKPIRLRQKIPSSAQRIGYERNLPTW